MARLYDELDAYLRREQVSKADFCRFTGFPLRTLSQLRFAVSWNQSNIDRLLAALAAWRDATPVQRAAARSLSPYPAPSHVHGARARQAGASSSRHLAAFGAARFKDGSAGPIFIDLARIVSPADVSREPCFRCGVNGAFGCEHRPAMAEAR